MSLSRRVLLSVFCGNARPEIHESVDYLRDHGDLENKSGPTADLRRELQGNMQKHAPVKARADPRCWPEPSVVPETEASKISNSSFRWDKFLGR